MINEDNAFSTLIDYYRTYVCSVDATGDASTAAFILNRIEGASKMLLRLEIINKDEYLRILEVLYYYKNNI